MEAKEAHVSAVLLNNDGPSDRELGFFMLDILESKGFKSQMILFDRGRINQAIKDAVIAIGPQFVLMNMQFPYERYKEGLKEFTESLDEDGISVILATDGEDEAITDFMQCQYNPHVFHLVKPFDLDELTQLIYNASNPKVGFSHPPNNPLE